MVSNNNNKGVGTIYLISEMCVLVQVEIVKVVEFVRTQMAAILHILVP